MLCPCLLSKLKPCLCLPLVGVSLLALHTARTLLLASRVEREDPRVTPRLISKALDLSRCARRHVIKTPHAIGALHVPSYSLLNDNHCRQRLSSAILLLHSACDHCAGHGAHNVEPSKLLLKPGLRPELTHSAPRRGQPSSNPLLYLGSLRSSRMLRGEGGGEACVQCPCFECRRLAGHFSRRAEGA